jgi:DNA-binding response OmpR family regulator
MLGDDPPDVMVLDLNMPGMGGMAVLRQVRETYPAIQVIILTGHGSPGDREESLRLGAFAYLEKPLEVRELMSAVRAAGEKLGLLDPEDGTQ